MILTAHDGIPGFSTCLRALEKITERRQEASAGLGKAFRPVQNGTATLHVRVRVRGRVSPGSFGSYHGHPFVQPTAGDFRAAARAPVPHTRPATRLRCAAPRVPFGGLHHD